MPFKMSFDPELMYLPSEVTKIIGFAPQTLAKWRCLGSGPVYLKIGGRVFYPGRALNMWISDAVRSPSETR